MSTIVPAVLPVSKRDLDDKLALFSTLPGVDRVQIDVVDGKFASPASFPYIAPAELSELTLPALGRIEYEIDLMCFDAAAAADAWLARGAARLTIHAESATNLAHLISSIRSSHGEFVEIGLAVNLASDTALIEPFLDRIQYVQFMGIATIGRQGEPLDRRVIERLRTFNHRHPRVPLQVDGGVTLANARELLEAGATRLISGSAILGADDPSVAVAAFQKLASQ